MQSRGSGSCKVVGVAVAESRERRLQSRGSGGCRVVGVADAASRGLWYNAYARHQHESNITLPVGAEKIRYVCGV